MTPPPIQLVPKAAGRLSWLEQLRRLQQYIINSPYFSWSVAAYVQLLLLIILGVLVLEPVRKEEPLQISVSFSSSSPKVDEEEAEVVIAPPEQEPEPEPEPEPELPQPELPDEPVVVPTEHPEPNEVTPTHFERIPQAVPSQPQGQTDSETSPSQPQPKPAVPEKPKPEPPQVRPAPPHATVVGAFCAWTEPELPVPGESYVIVIQVTLPERIKRYASGDLSGVIIGADGYRKFIHGHKAHFLPIVDHTARIRIPVIGAERARKDSIIIQSRILRQRQLIELSYEPW